MSLTKTTRLGEIRQETWDLSELLPDAREATLSSRLSDLEIDVESFESWRPKLSSDLDPVLLVELLDEYEALVTKLIVLGYYGSLWFASNTQNQEALDYRNRIEQILTGVENRMLFFTLWWKQLDDAAAERLLPARSEHPDYRHFLSDLRRFKPFTLDEQREQIINLKDADGQDALLTIYSMLTNRLEFRIEVEGKEQILTRDELQGYVHSPDAKLRATAYQELYRVFKKEQSILGQIYVHRVRDWYSENVGVRSFPTPISVRNLANDIPDAAVTTLLDVVSENNHVFQKYFRLKAKWLGIEKLSRYDLYAPLTVSERRVEYPAAVELVLDTMADFHPSVAQQAQRVFVERHIDSEIRKGKKGGAFCATVLPSQTPWLLINYTGRVRDVATLAHELGHAIHSMLAEDHSILTQHASLPLAETASVFSEMLLTDRLLAEESDPLVRRELLVAAVDDIYATVLRQAYFVRFELAAHDAIRGGGTAKALDELYMQTLESQFGDAVDVPADFRREWMMIPHIYQTPFYCYSYCFGQLLVLALYQRYKEEGDTFVPGYLKLLSAGGSARPGALLAEAGVDITEAKFWRGGFAVVEGLIDDLAATD